MEYLPLISITVLYFLFAFLKPLFNSKLPFNFCSICAAVSLTWIGLTILWLLGYMVPLLTLGILMGMSITGVMYKAEGLYKKLNIKNFWLVRLVIIVGGFYGIYTFLEKNWPVFSLIAISAFFVLIIATFLFQGTTHQEALRESKGKKSLIKKLDNCC